MEIIADGDIRFLETGTPDVIAYERTLGDEKLSVYCNLKGTEVTADSMPEGEILVSNYGQAGDKGVLRPFEARVIKA